MYYRFSWAFKLFNLPTRYSGRHRGLPPLPSVRQQEPWPGAEARCWWGEEEAVVPATSGLCSVGHECIQFIAMVKDTHFSLFLHSDSFGNVSVKEVSSILRCTF